MTKVIRTGRGICRSIDISLFRVPQSLGTLVKLLKFNVMVNIKYIQIYLIHNIKAGVHNGRRKACGGEVLPYMEKILNNTFILAFFDLKLGLFNSMYTISIYQVLFF